MAKAKVICSKCGATGLSKCPYCRSVFPDNQYAAVLGRILRVRIAQELEITRIKVDYVVDSDWSLERAWDYLHDLFHNLVIERIKVTQLACEHNWVFAPGEVSEIGCGHENREALPPGVYEGTIVDAADKGDAMSIVFKVGDEEFKVTHKRQEFTREEEP